jgi:hypothetical protein
VSGLSREKALERLERTFPARLQRQAAAFRRRVLANANPHRPRARERRTLKLLEEVPVAVTEAPAAHRRRCEGCGDRLTALARSDARFCSGRCRMRVHRARVARIPHLFTMPVAAR